jgi:hypothetical protein
MVWIYFTRTLTLFFKYSQSQYQDFKLSLEQLSYLRQLLHSENLNNLLKVEESATENGNPGVLFETAELNRLNLLVLVPLYTI